MTHGAKIAVLFPGTGYTCDKPLLRRIAERYASLGYDVVRIEYGGIDFEPIETLAEALDAVKPAVRAQTDSLPLDAADVVFVGKSFGTSVAAWLDTERGASARFILLTPTKEAVELLHTPERVAFVAIGTRDRHLDGTELSILCREKGVRCLLVDGGDHSLVCPGRDDVSEQALDEIANLCR